LSEPRVEEGDYLFPKTLKSWLLILLVLISFGYFIHEKMEQKRIAGIGPVEDQPIQESTDAPPIQSKDFTIEPVARYTVRAKVLSIERYRMGEESDLSPVDFVLGWGPMSNNEIIKKLNISQSDRWYNYSWSGNPPIDLAVIIRTSANTHLVPADDMVKSRLFKVRVGEIVNLKGYLVNIKFRDGRMWRSSLTREDSGGGACELMLVEEAVIEN